jgi:hypothetical protein
VATLEGVLKLEMSNESSIVKCSHCKKILLSEDFETHRCKKSLIGVKNIPVIDFSDTSCNDRKIMTGWGVDGVLYTFEVVPRKPIPIIISASDGFLQRKKSDEDLTEPAWRCCYLFD